jgi:hypothetical protein
MWLQNRWLHRVTKATSTRSHEIWWLRSHIFSKTHNIKWDLAKELWIKNIIKYNENTKKNSISLFGSESDYFTRHISEYQNHRLIQLCSKNCNLNQNVIIQTNCDKIYFKKQKGNVILYSGFERKCKNCKENISCEIP